MVLHILELKTGRPRPDWIFDASAIFLTHAMTDDGLSDRAPFRKWAVDATAAPQSIDALRMNQIPPDRREFAWLQRRRHSPCGLLIPAEWAMDSIHYRYDGENQYVRALWRLGHESRTFRLSVLVLTSCADPVHTSHLLCPPFAQMVRSLQSQHPVEANSYSE
jgi:hypothetical protein